MPVFSPVDVFDKFTCKCLTIGVGCPMKAEQALEVLLTLFLRCGLPDYIHSDNGAEFTAKVCKIG